MAKTQRLKKALSDSLGSKDVAQLRQRCLFELTQRTPAQLQLLSKTGISEELELALSSVFVSHPQEEPTYGTRSSLVAIYENGTGLSLTETTHAWPYTAAQTAQAQLRWPALAPTPRQGKPIRP